MNTKALGTIVMVAGLLTSLNSRAAASGEGARKVDRSGGVTAPAPVEKLDDRIEQLSVDKEVTDADVASYDEMAKHALNEEKQLQKEINGIEKQIKSLAKGVERSKMKSELAIKRQELAEHRRDDARKRLSLSEKQKETAERKQGELEAKVKKVESQIRDIKGETDGYAQDIRNAEKESLQLSRRLQKVEVQLVAEKRKRDQLRARQTRLQQDNKRLKSEVSRNERRLQRHS